MTVSDAPTITQDTDLLADRLNQEPVIFRGSTHSELGLILLCAIAFWVPVGLVIGALLGVVMMGLGLATLGVLLTIIVGSTVFQRIKRGRPDYYYQQQLLIVLDRWGLRGSSLIRRGGAWDLGRTENHYGDNRDNRDNGDHRDHGDDRRIGHHNREKIDAL